MYLYVLYAYVEGGPKLFALASQKATIFFKEALQFLLSPVAPHLPQAHLEKKETYVTTQKLC